MKPITKLIEKRGSQVAVAKDLGVSPTQITRWIKVGAMVDKYGNVWIISRKAGQESCKAEG